MNNYTINAPLYMQGDTELGNLLIIMMVGGFVFVLLGVKVWDAIEEAHKHRKALTGGKRRPNLQTRLYRAYKRKHRAKLKRLQAN
ncbi:MAG: hypothetical protein FWF59_00410 [Turicibacter sp.]|nr:hypothetical protein [Turicibacter sp.]